MKIKPFTRVTPTPESEKKINTISEAFSNFYTILESVCPANPELSVASGKLKDALNWCCDSVIAEQSGCCNSATPCQQPNTPQAA